MGNPHQDRGIDCGAGLDRLGDRGGTLQLEKRGAGDRVHTGVAAKQALDARRRQAPPDLEPVAAVAPVQSVRHLPVEARKERRSDRPEAREVESGVASNQRVVGPANLLHSALQAVRPLRKLQRIPGPTRLALRHHREHVGVHVHAFAPSQEPQNEADELPLGLRSIEGSSPPQTRSMIRLTSCASSSPPSDRRVTPERSAAARASRHASPLPIVGEV